MPYKRIIVITKKEKISEFVSVFQDKIELIDEDNIVEGLTINKVKDYFKLKHAEQDRAGWYFQQFLKLGISKSDMISDFYLIWDADCVALSPISFFSKEKKLLIDTTSEYHQPYFDIIEKLLGIKKQVDYSFISEHIVFDKSIVQGLLDQISSEAESDWWIEILEKIEPCNLSRSGFSEYELYGNYLAKYYPEYFEVRKLRKTRKGTKLLGLQPSSIGLFMFSLVFDYISFEEWQEKYKPLPFRYINILKVLFVGMSKNIFK